MKTNHTPGPWMVQTSTDNSLLYEVVDSPTESYVIAGPFAKPNKMKPDKRDDQVWADATLIAAAPEMLKALQAIAVSATEFADQGIPMNAECVGIISKWANRAIAKATAAN